MTPESYTPTEQQIIAEFKEQLPRILYGRWPPIVTMAAVVRATAREFGFNTIELTSAQQGPFLPSVRYIAMDICRHDLGKTAEQIGRVLNRDRATIQHGLTRARELADASPAWRAARQRVRIALRLEQKHDQAS